MKRRLSLFLVYLHLLIYVLPVQILAQQQLKVVKIHGGRFAANGGTLKGVTKGMTYKIVRNQKEIGMAKVVAVRENYCALQLIDSYSKISVQVNDQLFLDNNYFNEADDLLESVAVEEFSKQEIISHSGKNYFYEGEQKANNEYSAGGAMTGGLASGFLLGLIGWGIGYAIVSSNDPVVPSYHLSGLNGQQQFEFSSGYKQTVKKKRNGKFNAGAAIGTLISIIVLVNMNSNQNN